MQYPYAAVVRNIALAWRWPIFLLRRASNLREGKANDGLDIGFWVGDSVRRMEGAGEGALGSAVGLKEGEDEGVLEGSAVGLGEGADVRALEGRAVGL